MKRYTCLAAIVLLALVAADKKKPMPSAGQEFYFEPGSFKFINCDAEFRDPSDVKWPNFFYGRPAGGTHVYDARNPRASVQVVFDKMCQEKGDQSRKVLGEFSRPGEPPVVSFTISAMKAPQAETVTVQGKKGPEQKHVELSELDAVLDIGGRKLPLKPKATFTYHADKQGAIERCAIETRFTVPAGQLGLRAMKADAPVDIRITINGSATKAPPAKK